MRPMLLKGLDAKLRGERQDSPAVQVGAFQIKVEVESQLPPAAQDVAQASVPHRPGMRPADVGLVH